MLPAGDESDGASADFAGMISTCNERHVAGSDPGSVACKFYEFAQSLAVLR